MVGVLGLGLVGSLLAWEPLPARTVSFATPSNSIGLAGRLAAHVLHGADLLAGRGVLADNHDGPVEDVSPVAPVDDAATAEAVSGVLGDRELAPWPAPLTAPVPDVFVPELSDEYTAVYRRADGVLVSRTAGSVQRFYDDTGALVPIAPSVSLGGDGVVRGEGSPAAVEISSDNKGRPVLVVPVSVDLRKNKGKKPGQPVGPKPDRCHPLGGAAGGDDRDH